MYQTGESDGGKDSKRKRVFKPKTKTGCLTCRIRRIKCDEAKPNCAKCTNTGRKCDGYSIDAGDMRKTPPYTNSNIAKSPSPQTPVMEVLPLRGTKQEQRAFHYFQHETVPQICGFYKSQFWFQCVLQACHYSPAIRHAAIALGALHEQYSSTEPSTIVTKRGQDLVAGGFALQQYNAAIQALFDPPNGKLCKPRQKIDVALVTCILFACFDALRGHLGTVFHHIDAGVRILAELQQRQLQSSKPPSPSSPKASTSVPATVSEDPTTSLFVPVSTLNVLFTRLDIQSSTMIGSRRLGLVPTTNIHTTNTIPIPSVFPSFESARDAQDTIFRHWHHDFRRTITNGAESPIPIPYLQSGGLDELPAPSQLSYMKEKYSAILSSWKRAYEIFLDRNPTKRGCPADHTLQLLYIFTYMHADVDHAKSAEDEMTWDAYNSHFEKLVHHASAIISSSASITKTRTIFTIDTLLISPLYFAASRCRHPTIRRAAIKCLVEANRQEGLWESKSLAQVAQRVMEIEEEGVAMGEGSDGSEIPGWKRISSVQPELSSDGRRAIVHYFTKVPGDGGEPLISVTEILEW